MRDASADVAKATQLSRAPAITRAGAVLRLLGESPTPLGVQAIARELGIVPSTCLYVLRALAIEGLVSFDPRKKLYRLEVGILALARQWLQQDRVCDLAAPVLEGLADSFDVGTLALQRVGLEQNVVIAVSRAGAAPGFHARIGMSFPALFSAVGPCIAASTDEFVAAVAALEPAGSPMWSAWRYAAIYCFSTCPAASRIGTVHADLVSRTQGVGGDLCLQDFGPVFDELAKKVAEAVTLACDWEIPLPPNGETFDPGKTNVQLAIDGTLATEMLPKAADATSCGDMQGWYYDDAVAPQRVVACASTCSRIQAASEAKVDLLFGCETVILQ